MRLELPTQLETYIEYKVASGLYSNSAEVIRDALRHMLLADEEANRVLRLRAALQVGRDDLDRGDTRRYEATTLAQLQERAHARDDAPAPETVAVTPDSI